MLYVKPASPAVTVRHPVTGHVVPAEGRHIDETDLDWARILNDGDLVEATPAKPARKGHAASDAS